MATDEAVQPAGIAAVSRVLVSAAAELVAGVERVVVGDANVRTAQGNAWDAICADRARAQARAEMNELVAKLLANGGPARHEVGPSPRAELGLISSAAAN